MSNPWTTNGIAYEFDKLAARYDAQLQKKLADVRKYLRAAHECRLLAEELRKGSLPNELISGLRYEFAVDPAEGRRTLRDLAEDEESLDIPLETIQNAVHCAYSDAFWNAVKQERNGR